MVTVVRRCCCISWSMAACTTRSLAVSSADVASSRSSTEGSRTMARAMATRCFCPPDSLPPRSPTSVSYPSGRLSMMKLCALAALEALTIISSVAPSLP
mmetsp:Transcript_7462/g.16364  ORF Transcript_7462/g.16364 Transcript_7462/m.16364 type:complete len:99 (+) Transcript_7462:2383-2679(+)